MSDETKGEATATQGVEELRPYRLYTVRETAKILNTTIEAVRLMLKHRMIRSHKVRPTSHARITGRAIQIFCETEERG